MFAVAWILHNEYFWTFSDLWCTCSALFTMWPWAHLQSKSSLPGMSMISMIAVLLLQASTFSTVLANIGFRIITICCANLTKKSLETFTSEMMQGGRTYILLLLSSTLVSDLRCSRGAISAPHSTPPQLTLHNLITPHITTSTWQHFLIRKLPHIHTMSQKRKKDTTLYFFLST